MEANQSSLNERTGEHHTPVPGRNWDNFFDKLRLFVLLLIKLVLNLSMLESCFLCLGLGMFVVENTKFITELVCVAIFIDLVDILIGVVVIISVIMGYQRIMKMYYKYSIYIFVLLSIICCVLLFSVLYILRRIGPVIYLLVFLFLALLMQLYLNYSIKKEVMKLRSNEQCRL